MYNQLEIWRKSLSSFISNEKDLKILFDRLSTNHFKERIKERHSSIREVFKVLKDGSIEVQKSSRFGEKNIFDVSYKLKNKILLQKVYVNPDNGEIENKAFITFIRTDFNRYRDKMKSDKDLHWIVRKKRKFIYS